MKKLDKLILKAFVPPFVLTFFVVLFILLIQLMSQFIDEFVGKDIGLFIFSKMLFYFSLHLTPTALPLAILLSSLIAFGNLGEHSELTAIKSAGISLLRILRPVAVLALIITFLAFWFNNNIVPIANLNAYSLLYDIRTTKASLDIKEGAFYNGIPDYSIKVSKKYPDGKSLKNLMLYKHEGMEGNKQVILADSGLMYTIKNDAYLVLELFNGNSYTTGSNNFDQKNKKDEFTRNQFDKSKMVFSLSSFQMDTTDKSLFKGHRVMRTVFELDDDIDSLNQRINKYKDESYKNLLGYYSYHQKEYLSDIKKNSTKKIDSLVAKTQNDSIKSKLKLIDSVLLSNKIKTQKLSKKKEPIVLEKAYIDSLYKNASKEENTAALYEQAHVKAKNLKNYYQSRLDFLENYKKEKRFFQIEKNRKYTYSIACFIMFLIGAPLGAIIKKGGLGIPVLVSVLFFVFFYIMSMMGEKWAKDNVLPIMAGMWQANFILLCFGLIFLRQARNDSRLFDKDVYLHFFKRLKKKYIKSSISN